METWKLLSTPQKLGLLELLLRNQARKIRIRDAAKAAGVSPGFASKYVKLLEKEGVAGKGGMDYGNPRVRALKAFLNLELIFSAGVVGVIRKEMPMATGVGVYGSWHSGMNEERSDLDIWVRTRERPEPALPARAARLCGERLGKGAGVELNVISDEELAGLKGRGDPFYFSLFNSFVLWGEGID